MHYRSVALLVLSSWLVVGGGGTVAQETAHLEPAHQEPGVRVWSSATAC